MTTVLLVVNERSMGVDRLIKSTLLVTAGRCSYFVGIKMESDGPLLSVAFRRHYLQSFRSGLELRCSMQRRPASRTMSRPLQMDRTGRHRFRNVATGAPSVPVPSPDEHRVKNTKPILPEGQNHRRLFIMYMGVGDHV